MDIDKQKSMGDFLEPNFLFSDLDFLIGFWSLVNFFFFFKKHAIFYTMMTTRQKMLFFVLSLFLLLTSLPATMALFVAGIMCTTKHSHIF